MQLHQPFSMVMTPEPYTETDQAVPKVPQIAANGMIFVSLETITEKKKLRYFGSG